MPRKNIYNSSEICIFRRNTTLTDTFVRQSDMPNSPLRGDVKKVVVLSGTYHKGGSRVKRVKTQ